MSPDVTLPPFSRRRALIGGGALAAAAVAGAPLTAQARGRDLSKDFERAAAAHRVPYEILVALAWSETRLQQHDGRPSGSRTYGITSIANRPGHDDLTSGAKLIGQSPDRVRTDVATNILATAALLSARADKLGLSASDRRGLARWYPVLAAHSGATDPRTAALYADGVFAALVQGTVPDAPVRLRGRAVEADRRSTDAPSRGQAMTMQSAETAAAAKQAWAHPSNYQVANRPNDLRIDRVVIHVTQGSYAGSISWFQNASSNVSAHYVVRSSDGEVTQCVRHKDIAYHAGVWSWNQRSIGIEHEGYVDNPSWFTGAMYRGSAAITTSLCSTFGIPRTRTGIVGHNEVPGATHTDPGRYWDWSQYMALVTGGGQPPAGAWTEVVDNTTAGRFTASANWQRSTYASNRYGADYAYATPVEASDVAWYSFTLPSAGNYKVDVWHPSVAGYNAATPFHVGTSAGNRVVYLDQSSGGGQWRTLGTYAFAAGSQRPVGVSRWTSGTGYVIADAVRMTRV